MSFGRKSQAGSQSHRPRLQRTIPHGTEILVQEQGCKSSSLLPITALGTCKLMYSESCYALTVSSSICLLNNNLQTMASPRTYAKASAALTAFRP